MLNSRFLRAALGALVVASSTAVAEKMKPPTKMLGESTTTIVVADYKEAGPANRIVFSKVKVLQSRGDVPELIDLGKPDLREPLVAGKRYVVAYSPFAEDRFERFVVNSRGAQFLSSPGIEPGLWDDSKENRALVMWRIDGEESQREEEDEFEQESEGAEKVLPALLKMLRSDDRQRREFAAAEIALRPALVAQLDDAEQEAVQQFVVSDDAPDRARTALLNAAVGMPASSRAVGGWDKVVSELLGAGPVQVLGLERRSSLILAALAYPPSRLRHANGKLHQRWLRSDDLGLVEAAAMALQDMSIDVAKRALASALADDSLAKDNRSVLVGFEQRLKLMTPAR